MGRKLAKWGTISIFLLLIISFCYILADCFFFQGSIQYTYETLEGEWNIDIQSADTDITDTVTTPLSSYAIKVNSKDTIIELSTTLTQQSFPGPAIHLSYELCSLEVLLDGELIYSYGENAENIYDLCKLNHFISLPKDYAGKTLTIRISPKYIGAVTSLTPVYFGNYSDLMIHWMRSQSFTLFIGGFMILFGTILLLLSPAIIVFFHARKRVLFNALFSLILGIYVSCYQQIFGLFEQMTPICLFLESVSSYLLPFLVASHICFTIQKKRRRSYIILSTIELLFFAVTLFFAIRMPDTIPYLHLALCALCILQAPPVLYSIYIMLFVDGSKEKTTNNLPYYYTASYGFLLFIITVLFEVIRVILYTFTSIPGNLHGKATFLTFGSSIMVMSMIASYFLYIVGNHMLSEKLAALHTLAFIDPLTGLSNRAYADSILRNLNSTFEDYGIISLDLDFLKSSNDTYGHLAGDRLLKNFAEQLKECFPDAALIARMGGDEFLVIITETSPAFYTDHITELNHRLALLSEEDPELNYSASYGCAYRHEIDDGNPLRVYLLSDERMYLIKQVRHREATRKNSNKEVEKS